MVNVFDQVRPDVKAAVFLAPIAENEQLASK